MKIYYGISDNKIDITDFCLSKLLYNNIITIPHGDINRAEIFSDPLPRIHKKIFIENDGNITEYNEDIHIKINITDNSVVTINEDDINNKIANIHSKLTINYGYLTEELPEQKMVVRYLTGKEKVLEIGGNIGRNSLVISSILEDAKNLVSLECDLIRVEELKENRDANNLYFHIESSALSNRRLIQKGGDTIPSDYLLPEYNWVNTISLEDLKSKYNIEFDTLVLDCEGAFYYILMDMPEILNGINLIIMENDYHHISHKYYINEVLKSANFYVDYLECGGWGPCYPNFFEVWKKVI